MSAGRPLKDFLCPPLHVTEIWSNNIWYMSLTVHRNAHVTVPYYIQILHVYCTWQRTLSPRRRVITDGQTRLQKTSQCEGRGTGGRTAVRCISLPCAPALTDDYPRMTGYPKIGVERNESASRKTIIFECSVPVANPATADDEYEVKWVRDEQERPHQLMDGGKTSVIIAIANPFNPQSVKLGFNVTIDLLLLHFWTCCL